MRPLHHQVFSSLLVCPQKCTAAVLQRTCPASCSASSSASVVEGGRCYMPRSGAAGWDASLQGAGAHVTF